MVEADFTKFNYPLTGTNLPANNFSELLSKDKLVIFHFLRHLGCIFCQHSVDQLYQLSQKNSQFPTIYFVHQGTLEAGDVFFTLHFPNARHIADPDLQLYKHFGIHKLEGFNIFNPKMIWKGILLTLKGYLNRYKGGNVALLSGTFLFNNGNLVWRHYAKYAGDEPNWAKLNLS